MDLHSMCIPLYVGQTPVETAAGDIHTYTFSSPAIVRDFQLLVTGAVVATDTTDAQVAIDYDSTSAARVEKVEFTIADEAVVGTSYDAHTVGTDWESFDVDRGDKIIVEQTTAGADASTETGEYIVLMFVSFYSDKWI